jgi:carbon monoxide dehydrogenase subunit G
MTCFSATNHSHAVVPVERKKVWAALTDPDLLPQLTPLLRSIKATGDTWEWHLTSLTVLGIGLAPVFTEHMTFDEPNRIDYEHRPPGKSERAGADGWYILEDHPEGTHLEIKLTMHVDLPLSRLAAPAVNRVMSSMMQRTGERFATNLLKHLGAD